MIGAEEPPEKGGCSGVRTVQQFHKGIVKANRVRVNVPRVAQDVKKNANCIALYSL